MDSSATGQKTTTSSGSFKVGGYLKREEIIGKPVVTSDAIIIGNVKDIAVSIDGKAALEVDRKSDGSDMPDTPHEVFVDSEDIQAVGDVILLRHSKSGLVQQSTESKKTTLTTSAPPSFPSGTPSAPQHACPKCGFLNTPNSRFCIKCGSSLQS